MNGGGRTAAKWAQLLLVAALTAALVTPIALADAEGPRGASSAKPVGVAKGLKALKKRASKLVRRVAALKAQNAALEKRGSPASALPSGPAGGDLTGSYPDPRILPNAVGSREIADGAVTSAKIADRTLTGVDIAPGGITSPTIADGTTVASQIAPETFRARNLAGFFAFPLAGQNEGAAAVPPGGQSARVFVTCPGNSRIISGGWEWGRLDGNGTTILRSSPAQDDPFHSWEIIAKIEARGDNNTIFPEALCLVQ